MDELALLDASAQADLVRRKEVKAVELLDDAIERIERLNPTLNAVVTPLYDQARAAASAPLPDGPFAGVPFLLKDLGVEYAGAPLRAGSAFLRDYVSPDDSELVRRYKGAGLIILGKTNAPELGLVPTTEPLLFGPTRNPWDTSRTPGGSSGGSAAAVASGMVPAAHGNDGGGSLRIPASCCGLFGLKPTRARLPISPGSDIAGALGQDHVLTRSVRDSAALLDATAGPDLGAPYWAPPPLRPFAQEVGADPGRLRIAFTTYTLTGTSLDPDCVTAVRDAAALCADLGHELTEAVPNLDGERLTQAFDTVWAAGCARTLDGLSRLHDRELTPALFEPLTWALYERGRRVSASDYLLAISDLGWASRDVAHFLLDYDLWLTPTLGEPPLPLGALAPAPGDPLAGYFRAFAFVPFTPLSNASGQPAISVPLYWNAEGLPVGVHFLAPFGDEATLFRLAAQLEAARPWANRRPPVSA